MVCWNTDIHDQIKESMKECANGQSTLAAYHAAMFLRARDGIGRIGIGRRGSTACQ